MPVVLNPAPACPLEDRLLRRIAVLTPNEHEAEILSGIAVADERGAREAAARLHARGPATVVITRGGRGVYASASEFEGVIPAFKVDPVDTTAAGDVFNGALAVALAEKVPLLDALSFAQAAAAISATRPRRPALGPDARGDRSVPGGSISEQAPGYS